MTGLYSSYGIVDIIITYEAIQIVTDERWSLQIARVL